MRDVLVLCYHALSPGWPAALAIAPGVFEAQVDFLLRRGYRAATFTQAVTRPPAPRTVGFTFDDGFRSVIEYALPILASRGAPATVFVPTDFPDRPRLLWPGIDHWPGGPHEPELAPMSWSDLESLAALGWEIGSHTRTHPRLPQLEDGELRTELVESRRACEERLGLPSRSLAYPYGDVEQRVVAATAAAGYTTAAALPVRLNRRRLHEWPRIGVFSEDHPRCFRAKVSRGRRRLIGWEAGEALLRAQRRLHG